MICDPYSPHNYHGARARTNCYLDRGTMLSGLENDALHSDADF